MGVKAKKDKDGNIIPGVWKIDYRPNGRNGRRVIRDYGSPEDPRTESEALELHMELVRHSRREPVPITNPKFYDLLSDWKAEYANSHASSTVKDLNHCLVHLVKFFGKLYVSEITHSIIERYKAARLKDKHLIRKKDEKDEDFLARREKDGKPITKRTINKELSYLSAFLTWAEENRYSSIPPKVKLFPIKQTKAAAPRPLHPEEVNAILEHLEKHYHLVFLLYNDAGLRRSEALGGGQYEGLRSRDIDLKFGVIYVRGKGDKERIVPITTNRLRTALEETIKTVKKDDFLCVNPKTGKPWYSIRKALTRAAENAGINRRVYHHLLRHNFGTHATAAGINLRSVQEMMGHSTIKTTEIYTHMAPYLQTEAEKFSKFVETETTVENDSENK